MTSLPVLAQAGRLDSTFGRGGKVLTSVPGPSTAIANAMALQNDGKILVTGGLGVGQGIGVVRYNSNGTLDIHFGQGGIAVANIADNILSSATAVAVQADNKIIAAGTIYLLSGATPFIGLGVVRFNANGTMDATFGQAGLVGSLPFNARECDAGPATLQPDGKILLAGCGPQNCHPNCVGNVSYGASSASLHIEGRPSQRALIA
jgi:uncharacterized delta-60 repeat protein